MTQVCNGILVKLMGVYVSYDMKDGQKILPLSENNKLQKKPMHYKNLLIKRKKYVRRLIMDIGGRNKILRMG
jgi:hypothetical protein